MGAVELEVLEACREATQRQEEMLPLLAAALGVAPEEVFYTWGFRKCAQHGDLSNDSWWYFFHGCDCDLMNRADGRFLRLDFGPGGRVDTVSPWGVLQLIMTSTAPWPEFRELKERFAGKRPPYDRFSGDSARLREVWHTLEDSGCFENHDPGLVELQARHEMVGEDGIRRICFPAEVSERRQLDCAVAHRHHLSERGRQLLVQHSAVRYG